MTNREREFNQQGGTKMSFKEWKELITKKLMEIGFNEDYSKQKASGIRGCYYDKNNYIDPEEAVKNIVKRSHVALLSPEQVKKYEETYKQSKRLGSYDLHGVYFG